MNRNIEIQTFFQIQLYSKENANVPKITVGLILVVIEGPRIANFIPYNKILIPIVKVIAENAIISMFLLKYFILKPKLSPSKPVVNMKMNNSVGCSIATRRIVRKYVITPMFIENRHANTIGAVLIILNI